ncbi:hypothetical protein G6F62_015523 [Rhizopus arrhizus]|nr:hypothetical protein G6F62_015523 [Rhizopus arrhizus]
MKGALPPSSSDSFLMVGAHCSISVRPTSVDPVKLSLRTTSLSHSAAPISRELPVMTWNTPAGTPASSASTASASRSVAHATTAPCAWAVSVRLR